MQDDVTVFFEDKNKGFVKWEEMKYEMVNRNGVRSGCFRNIHRRGGGHHRRELPDGLTHLFGEGTERK